MYSLLTNSVITNLFLLLYLCHCHVWRVTIQQLGPNYLHVAEVNFFYKNKLLDGSNFEFTSTSYANTISIGGHNSGPPEAANDGNINTFFHSGFQSAEGGNTGICCPDPNPALFITNINNITFERIRIINRQDLDGDNMHFFNRIIGTTVTVQDVDKNEVIFRKEIRYGESSYDFHIHASEFSSPNIAAHKWMETSYFNQSAHNLWIDDTTFNYKGAHLHKYSFDDLQPCFRNKTVLMIGDSTGRETLFHMIRLVTGKYPSPDGSYPPSDYTVDFEGSCKGRYPRVYDKKDCIREWNLGGTTWLVQFVGFLTEERKTQLRESLTGKRVDIILLTYSIWPQEVQSGDEEYYKQRLQWLLNFIRTTFDYWVPLYWLGSLHVSSYDYQRSVWRSVLDLDDDRLSHYRSRCGGLGAWSVTPIERYGLGRQRHHDLIHFDSPSYELFSQMIFNWFCDCTKLNP